MEHLITLRVRLGREEYVCASRLYEKVQNARGLRRYTRGILALLFSLGLGAALVAVLAGGMPAIMPAGLIAAGAALFFLYKRQAVRAAGRAYDKSGEAAREQEISFFSSCVEESGEEKCWRWEEIDFAAEDRDAFALFCKNRAILLPSAALSGDEAVYIHNMFAVKLKNRFCYFASLRAKRVKQKGWLE